MTAQFIYVFLAIVGLACVALAFGLIPLLEKKEGEAQPKNFMSFFLVGCLLLGGSTYGAISTVYKKPTPVPKKHYNVPQITDWYFVNPIECKKALISGIAYSPEKFSEKNGCKIEKVDGVILMIRLDCTAMLDNIFYMVEGEKDCGQVHLMMREQAMKPAE